MLHYHFNVGLIDNAPNIWVILTDRPIYFKLTCYKLNKKLIYGIYELYARYNCNYCKKFYHNF